MPLNVRFFGTFEARYADRPLLFRSDKIRALLAYLVVEADRPQLRSTLAALFWGAQPDRIIPPHADDGWSRRHFEPSRLLSFSERTSHARDHHHDWPAI